MSEVNALAGGDHKGSRRIAERNMVRSGRTQKKTATSLATANLRAINGATGDLAKQSRTERRVNLNSGGTRETVGFVIARTRGMTWLHRDRGRELVYLRIRAPRRTEHKTKE